MKSDHLARMIRQRCELTPKDCAMRFKVGNSWTDISYKELNELIRRVASWLIDSGVKPGSNVAVYSANCPKWTIADLAIMTAGAVSVPIYETNTAAQAVHIINDAQIDTVFAGTKHHANNLTDFQQPLKIVVFDEAEAGPIPWKDVANHSIDNDTLDDLLTNAAVDSLATIIYTSGTTGLPKGVMLTHNNFINQFNALNQRFDVGSSDKSLCFLPLSHAYERTWSFYILITGATNYYLDDPKKIIEYLQEIRPTCMVAVPRLYEKIYAAAYDKLSRAKPTKKKLFNWAIKVGKEYAYRKKDGKFIGPWLAMNHGLADKLVLKKIRDIVGGPKNFFSAGGAALSPKIEEFFFAAGLLICEGYGLTETSPMITCNSPGAFKFGTVGKPILGAEVKISDHGEVLARGDNIMRGYFKRSDETNEVLKDGWLHTGDVGEIDDEGFLKITDRIKDLIITSSGKNIAPQRVEMIIGMDHYIEQLSTIGDGRQFLTALIVPNFEALEAWAGEQGIKFDTHKELINNEKVVDFFEDRIEAQSKELANYEKVKKFALLPKEFSQDGGEITPTMKTIRSTIAKKYSKEIEALYS